VSGWLDGQRRCQVARRTVYPQRAVVMRIQVLCFGDFHLDQQMFAQRGFAHFAQ
jgi:hypothetical protein